MRGELTLVELDIPFRRPLATAKGTIDARGSVLVRLATADAVGWGEAPAFPSGRFGTTARAFEDLAEPAGWKDGLPNVPIGRAALEAASADAAAREAGQPLHTWIGASGSPVAARHPLGLTDGRSIEADAAWLDSHGIEAVKLKIAPGHDLEPLRRLRSMLPDLDIGVDANGTYDSAADPVFAGLESVGVSFVEQPFPANDLESHRRLRQRIDIPVCIDESLGTAGDVDTILRADAADQLAVKLNRHGLSALESARSTAAAHRVGIRIGGTFDTSIGRRHLLAAAGLSGVVGAAVGPPAAYLAADIADYPELKSGTVAPEAAPGLGTEPDAALVEALARRRMTVDIRVGRS